MKILLYIVILAAMLLVPVERLDIAKLEPVEAVAVYMEGDRIVLETDSESVGRGVTAVQALQDLKDNALGIVYLDTAEYLLVADNAWEAAQQLRQFLKVSVQTGTYFGGSVKDEAKYLDVHGNSAKPEG